MRGKVAKSEFALFNYSCPIVHCSINVGVVPFESNNVKLEILRQRGAGWDRARS